MNLKVVNEISIMYREKQKDIAILRKEISTLTEVLSDKNISHSEYVNYSNTVSFLEKELSTMENQLLGINEVREHMLNLIK